MASLVYVTCVCAVGITQRLCAVGISHRLQTKDVIFSTKEQDDQEKEVSEVLK